jgi:hypothetical protein
MRVHDLSVQVDGVVRVMHPDNGMGVEFTQRTEQQRDAVKRFIETLMKSNGAVPELTVSPEGLEVAATEPAFRLASSQAVEDPLVDLFAHKSSLPADAFLAELRRQRNSGSESSHDPAAI